MDWLTTDGGPFVLGPLEILRKWRGTGGLSVSSEYLRGAFKESGIEEVSATDYAAACFSTHRRDRIWAFNGGPLVIPEPFEISVWLRSKGHFSLFHDVHIETDDELVSILPTIPINNSHEYLDYNVIDTTFVIMDAAYTIVDSYSLNKIVQFECEVGEYKIGYQGHAWGDDRKTGIFNFDLK